MLVSKHTYIHTSAVLVLCLERSEDEYMIRIK